MGLFRSEDMDLYRIFIDKNEAHNIMMELGKLGYVHFINLNSNIDTHKLVFSREVKQMEESCRYLGEIEKKYSKYSIEMSPVKSNDEFINLVNNWSKYNANGQPLLLDNIRDEIQKSYQHIQAQENLLDEAKKKFKRAVLNQEILKTFETFIKQAQASFVSQGLSNSQTEQLSDPLLINQIKYSGGIIMNTDMLSFRRTVFRQMRGKVFVHSFPITLEKGDQLKEEAFHENRNVFILAYQGGANVDDKIKRICNSYAEDDSVIEINSNYYGTELKETMEKKQNLKDFIKQTAIQMKDVLRHQDKNQDHDVSVFKLYKLFIMRQKQVYIHLNYLNQEGLTYQSLCWIPRIENFENDVNTIKGNGQIGLTIEKGDDDIALRRPTFFVLNDFTNVPQQIIDTYGVPTYKEVNPAIFACVTFPFFFGVMFGDVMHGSLLLAFSVYLCMRPKPAGTADPLHDSRYFLLLSGIFATFCGLIYNDFSSMNTMIAGKSCYEHFGKKPAAGQDFVLAEQKKNCVYPFGFDPIWYRSEQEIVFLNSFKMKTSVIFGVMQMSLGTVMKGFNAVYFKRYIELFFDVFTQIALLMALFGFMDILIFMKWTTDWDEVEADYNKNMATIKGDYKMAHVYTKGESTPSIIQTMIVMFIKMGTPPKTIEGQNPQAPIIGTLYDGYSTQGGVMRVMLVIALLSIPLMLLVNPCVNSKKGSDVDEGQPDKIVMTGEMREQELIKSPSQQNMRIEDLCDHMLIHDQQHSFGELFIHQMIETIEYALGTVSNTASYLRLWALSLAHGQLAKVFFNFTVGILLKDGNTFGLWAAFYLFFAITFGVLMIMDLLEAMLHTLRLHWVEFQNKFFKGEGFAFSPMDFNKVFEEQEL